MIDKTSGLCNNGIIRKGGEGMATKKSFTVSLPDDLAEAIQRITAEKPEEFVITAVRHEIRRFDQLTAIRAAAGAWKDHDEIPDTVEELVAFMRRLRASEERFSP
jgi:metal-responsive CopG/Arc/MetJ family transcriptional regulator